MIIELLNVSHKVTWFINELIGCHSKEQMLESFSSFFKETPDEFRDSLGEFNKVKMVNGLFMSTWGSNITKVKRIKSICDKFKFNDVICEIM